MIIRSQGIFAIAFVALLLIVSFGLPIVGAVLLVHRFGADGWWFLGTMLLTGPLGYTIVADIVDPVT